MSALKNTKNISVTDFIVGATLSPKPHYLFLVSSQTTIEESHANLLDNALQTINLEYHEKRQSNRLDTIRIEQVPEESLRSMRTHELNSRNSSFEQFKPTYLVGDLSKFSDILKSIL
jgi:hypothetical protein